MQSHPHVHAQTHAQTHKQTRTHTQTHERADTLTPTHTHAHTRLHPQARPIDWDRIRALAPTLAETPLHTGTYEPNIPKVEDKPNVDEGMCV